MPLGIACSSFLAANNVFLCFYSYANVRMRAATLIHPARLCAQEWLEYQLLQPDWVLQLQEDERYVTILLVLRSMNEAFRRLYHGGAWLPQDDARAIGQLGLTALKGYAKIAMVSLSMGEPRCPLYPKFHMLLHQFYWLLWRSDTLDWVESPMVDCCQLCEGFIGHISRYSRRVSPQATVDRTIDLYLVSLWRHWETVL